MKLLKLNQEEKIMKIIDEINKSLVNKQNAESLLNKFDYLFSYFYTKKVELKRNNHLRKKQYLSNLFKKIDTFKVDIFFKVLEDIEILENRKFVDVEGRNILRRIKAKYRHSQQFFKKT